MLLPLILSLVVAQTPVSLGTSAPEPSGWLRSLVVAQQTPLALETSAPEPSRLREWLPWQGHLTFNAMSFAPKRTLGVDAYFGRAVGVGEFGPTGQGGGWFWGYGAHGTFGATQANACRTTSYCVGRWIVGPSIRGGRAWGFFRDEERTWPDGYAYAEAVAFVGRTVLESAPLIPQDAFLEAGARFAVAVNLVGWTRLATSGMESGFGGSSGGNELVAILLWLTLAFTNHFELNLEVSRGVAGPLVRGGFSIGSGF